MITDDIRKLEEEIIIAVQQCSKCKMCVAVCPTYETWLTEGPVGKLQATYYHIKHGIGTDKELSDLLFRCTTCGKCKLQCSSFSAGTDTVGTIVNARRLLAMKASKPK